MSSTPSDRRFHLNREGVWRGFEMHGLSLREDGAIELAPLPKAAPPPGLRALPSPDGPAGLAVAADSTIFATDPAGHRLWRWGPCEPEPTPAWCGGGGSLSGLRTPRAVLSWEQRGALVIADADAHRLLVVDRATQQLTGILGQPDRTSTDPGSEVGRLNGPIGLAADAAGALYVLERGNRRVQKFDASGRVSRSFWDRVSDEGGTDPAAIAAVRREGVTEIYLLERTGRLLVVDPYGSQLYSLTLPHIADPLALAVGSGAIYVGDNTRRRILAFDTDGQFVGEAEAYDGPVAGLALTPDGRLVAHAGQLPLILLRPDGARRRRGWLWGGPFANPSGRQNQAHEIRLVAASQPAGAHLRLFVHQAATAAPPEVDTAAAHPFGADWAAFDPDVDAALLPGNPFDHVWIGLELSGEGEQSAALLDVTLELDVRDPLDDLPAFYREDPSGRDILRRFIALLQTATGDVAAEIDQAPSHLDPQAVADDRLAWLASWLAVPLDANRPAAERRATLSSAFAALGWRGTARGLADTLRSLSGLSLSIAEPIVEAGWWILADETGDPSATGARLGESTRLVATEPQGAVLDTTAMLDASRLTGSQEFATGMFDEVAHRFTVQVYRGAAFSDDAVLALRTLIDREKPAHTDYDILVVEPQMRLGFQSRLGIDTVVAGTPASGPWRLGHQVLVGEARTA